MSLFKAQERERMKRLAKTAQKIEKEAEKNRLKRESLANTTANKTTSGSTSSAMADLDLDSMPTGGGFNQSTRSTYAGELKSGFGETGMRSSFGTTTGKCGFAKPRRTTDAARGKRTLSDEMPSAVFFEYYAPEPDLAAEDPSVFFEIQPPTGFDVDELQKEERMNPMAYISTSEMPARYRPFFTSPSNTRNIFIPLYIYLNVVSARTKYAGHPPGNETDNYHLVTHAEAMEYTQPDHQLDSEKLEQRMQMHPGAVIAIDEIPPGLLFRFYNSGGPFITIHDYIKEVSAIRSGMTSVGSNVLPTYVMKADIPQSFAKYFSEYPFSTSQIPYNIYLARIGAKAGVHPAGTQVHQQGVLTPNTSGVQLSMKFPTPTMSVHVPPMSYQPTPPYGFHQHRP